MTGALICIVRSFRPSNNYCIEHELQSLEWKPIFRIRLGRRQTSYTDRKKRKKERKKKKKKRKKEKKEKKEERRKKKEERKKKEKKKEERKKERKERKKKKKEEEERKKERKKKRKRRRKRKKERKEKRKKEEEKERKKERKKKFDVSLWCIAHLDLSLWPHFATKHEPNLIRILGWSPSYNSRRPLVGNNPPCRIIQIN